MKLIDLLEVFDEYKNLYVYMDDECIAYYDGKNDIPSELNDRDVIRISTEDNGVSVEIR